MNPCNMVFDGKRLIGRTFHASTVQSDMKHWPFKVRATDGKLQITVQYKKEVNYFNPENIGALVLGKMKKTRKLISVAKLLRQLSRVKKNLENRFILTWSSHSVWRCSVCFQTV